MKKAYTTNIVKINPKDPNLIKLREVARASREGRIISFPTETVYGMGGPMSVKDLAGTLAQLKGRDEHKPFAFHIGEWEMVEYLGVERSPAFRFLTRLFWPGPLTLLAPNAAGETIGIRFPRNFLATALINATGEPFIATSANLSGSESPRTGEDVLKQMDGKISYLVDGGKCELAEDSTVVDLTDAKAPKMVREGACAAEIQEAIQRIKNGRFPRKRILIVCTGNSCRSPMAAGWLKEELGHVGLDGEIEVASCGVGTRAGTRATAEAVYVMQNREIDISEHRAALCTRADVVDADLIIAMSEQHASFITGMVPSVKHKILIFNVMDPIGMSMSVYEDVMNVIEKKMQEFWQEIIA